MWRVIFSKEAEKDFSKIDKTIREKILKSIKEKLVKNPDIYLKNLKGNKKELLKFVVGKYRVLCIKEEERLVIVVVEVGHRKEVYR